MDKIIVHYIYIIIYNLYNQNNCDKITAHAYFVDKINRKFILIIMILGNE